jgi:hypothetical protein
MHAEMPSAQDALRRRTRELLQDPTAYNSMVAKLRQENSHGQLVDLEFWLKRCVASSHHALSETEVANFIQTTVRAVADKWKQVSMVTLTGTSGDAVHVGLEWAKGASSFVENMLEHVPLNDDKEEIHVQVIPTGLTRSQLEQIKEFYFFASTPITMLNKVGITNYDLCLSEAHAVDAFIASDYLDITVLAHAAVRVLVHHITVALKRVQTDFSRLSTTGYNHLQHMMTPIFAYPPLFERVSKELSHAQNHQLKALTADGAGRGDSWIDATLHQGNVLGANPTWDLLMRYVRKQLSEGGAANVPRNLLPLEQWTAAIGLVGVAEINEFLDVMFADSHTSGWPGFECKIEITYRNNNRFTTCLVNGHELLVAFDAGEKPTEQYRLQGSLIRLKRENVDAADPLNYWGNWRGRNWQMIQEKFRMNLLVPIWHDLNNQNAARLREMPEKISAKPVGALKAMWDYAFGGEDTPDFAGGFVDGSL